LARLALEKQIADMEYQVKRQEIQRELALYRQAGMDQTKEAQKANLQLAQLDQQHTDQVKLQQEQQAAALRQSWAQISTGYAQTFMSVLQGHRSMTAAMGQLADQAAERMIAASLQVLMGNKSEQLSNAKTAASGAYKAMAGVPVIGPELGAVAAAAVFAGAMAFEGGTDRVPGVGRGDIVPSMLTPGEGIVPGGVMDGLRNVARNGGFDQRPSMTVHVRPVYNVNTIDGDGMQATLEKHTDQLQRHFEGVVRRMNR
jgi:hypothetical protein